MIKRLDLRNYKASRAFSIGLDKTNVIVGPNNAGKSTLMECLALVAFLTRRTFRREFIEVNQDSDGRSQWGLQFNPAEVGIETTNIVHKLQEGVEATVSAAFSEALVVTAHFPPTGSPYAVYKAEGDLLGSWDVAKRAIGTALARLPPVAPLEIREPVRDAKYVKSMYGTHLTPRHFRNYCYHVPTAFAALTSMAVKHMPEITVVKPGPEVDGMFMDVREKATRLTYEIAWLGHGLQVWVQLLTHIGVFAKTDALVLDEPEIYLHADLQRRLAHVLRSQDTQIMVATHSVDIMDEFEPECIVSVDRRDKRARRLSSIGEVQTAANELGAAANLQAAALLRAQVAVFVEGRDFKILRAIARGLGYEDFARRAGFVVVEIGGFGHWERVKNIDWVLRNVAGQRLISFLVLDPDYRSEYETAEVKKTLMGKNVRCRIWSRKELENYLLVPTAIARVLNRRLASEVSPSRVSVDASWVTERMWKCSRALRDDVESQLWRSGSSDPAHAGKDQSTTYREFKRRFKRTWADKQRRLCLIGGKDLLAALNRQFRDELGVSLSAGAIASELTNDEVDREVVRLIREVVEAAKARDG